MSKKKENKQASQTAQKKGSQGTKSSQSATNEKAKKAVKKKKAKPLKEAKTSKDSQTSEASDPEGSNASTDAPQQAVMDTPESTLPKSIGWRAWWKSTSLTGDGLSDGTTQFYILFGACLVYLTQLGFGLWDCWEPQYAETARMMLVRKDWVHPYWSYAYFLSKPILMFWYMAASMSVFGINEWAIRLPFGLHAVFLIWVLYFTVSRLFSRRAGVFAAIVIGTMPLTTFLGRQAIADILVGTYITAALCFFALAFFGPRQLREKADRENQETPVHTPYLVVFYAFIGLALLAKGLLGVGIPGIVVVGYLLFSGDWKLILRMRLVMGTIITFTIALPWYIHMCFFPGLNVEDNKTFYQRFILHDNLYRLFKGVHSDKTDKDHFLYFCRQLGYGMGLWAGFLPVALLSVGRFRSSKIDNSEKLRRFLFAWFAITLLFFSFSQTKFHHYIFPVLPIGAIFVGLWLDRYLRDHDQPLYKYSTLLILAGLGLVFRDLIKDPHHLVNLFVYKYDRAYPHALPLQIFGSLTPKSAMSFIASASAAFLLSGFFYDDKHNRRYLVRGMLAIAIVFTLYNAHGFMIKLTPHWSQQKLFQTLKKDSKLWKGLLSKTKVNGRSQYFPEEPLFAFRMRWHGEDYYSRNHIIQILGPHTYDRVHGMLNRYQKPGKPAYFILEASKGRLKALKRALGTYRARRLKIIDRSNHKYWLAKLLPKPKYERWDPDILKKDQRTRESYDDWEYKRRYKRKRYTKKRTYKNRTYRRTTRRYGNQNRYQRNRNRRKKQQSTTVQRRTRPSLIRPVLRKSESSSSSFQWPNAKTTPTSQPSSRPSQH